MEEVEKVIEEKQKSPDEIRREQKKKEKRDRQE